MPRRVPIPPPLRTGPFSVDTGAEHGITEGRMRGRDLARPFPAVRTIRRGLTVLERCREYQARMPPNQFFSHQTAAAIHGIPLPARLENRALQVSVFEGSQEPRMRGIVGHTVQAGLVSLVETGGLRAVSALDAWCQLASILSIDELIIAGDRLVSRKHPLSHLSEVKEAVGAFSGRRGVRRLRAALADVRSGVDSPKEWELRLIIVRSGLPEPAVNIPIFDRTGKQIAIGDLVYEGRRVLVEYDGEQHRLNDQQYARDVERLADLAAAGWTIVRFLKGHLRDRARVIRLVRSALADASHPLTPLS